MRDKVSSLVWSIAVVAIGGALTAVAAYATDHSADNPTLYAAIILAVREASKWWDRFDKTRAGTEGAK